MRTTLTIDDGLYRAVKARAASSGQTVGSVVEDALRALLLAQSSPDRAEPAALPVFDGHGLMPGVDLDDNASVNRLIDEGVDLDALR